MTEASVHKRIGLCQHESEILANSKKEVISFMGRKFLK